MKKTKVIIPALAMLLLSTAASVTGTVAWFSMNNAVTVTGMTVTTKVSSNLLIAETNHEDNYQDSIVQARKGILEPASAANGTSFFYTTKAKGDGSAIANGNTVNQATQTYLAYDEANGTALQNTPAGKAKYDAGFNTAYGFNNPAIDNPATTDVDEDAVCYAYIDYSFYIKATSASNDQVLYMSKCNLLYDGAAITKGYAWRVALLAANSAKETDTADSSLAVKSILGLEGSLNQNQVNPVTTTSFVVGETDVTSYFTDPYGKVAATGTYEAGKKYYSAPSAVASSQAVASVSALGAVTNPNAAAQARTDIDSGVTAYTKIVVRLWLEGEDVSCTSTTYADLTSSWTLDLEFQLGNADDGAESPVLSGVSKIGSVAAA